jgi:hypothetical protein
MPVKNICDCHNPPGGSVVCEAHQMAICIVINGVARRECHDPPSTGNATRLVNWALSHITGRDRAPEAAVSTTELRALDRGQVEVEFSQRAFVTFALPENVVAAVRTLRRGLDRGMEMGASA